MKIDVVKELFIIKDVTGHGIENGTSVIAETIYPLIGKVKCKHTDKDGYEWNVDLSFEELSDKRQVIDDFELSHTSPIFTEKFKKLKLNINKPAHYDTAIDTIAFAKANFTPEQVEGFMRINAIKYLQRAGKKDDKLSDLRKSAHYLQMLIEMEEGK